ncbi:hypothetical protein [Taibaiella soli]|uniref:Outer membrane protein beta-barrel domain-containing protein n=1 Tax=Taibaiella soli TaxID=1649169 RepID=A0A2W2A9J6_9BACT|nr:hypothetical protein [Taibaiella soli]PZF71941.1 hypothetical protein DN068_15645 [Taibaiella soli]
MIRHLLRTLLLLIVSISGFAKPFTDGLYFGVNFNAGLVYDPGSYFPYAALTTTSGIKAGYTIPGANVSVFTGLQYAHYKYSVDREYGGTQIADFLEVPVGLRIVGGGASKVKMYFEPALSICFLGNAEFQGAYKDGAFKYAPGDNKADCKQVILRPSLGWGFHFKASEHLAINLGWQMATNISSLYKESLPRPASTHLSAVTMQLGFEYHLGSLYETVIPKSKYRSRSGSGSSDYYDVNW